MVLFYNCFIITIVFFKPFKFQLNSYFPWMVREPFNKLIRYLFNSVTETRDNLVCRKTPSKKVKNEWKSPNNVYNCKS